jgi:hypothetical protein
VILNAYGDESHEGKGERVFAVAAVAGPDFMWPGLERAWLSRLDGRAFHAATCEREFASHPDSNKHKDNLQLYADLAKILAAGGITGVGAAIDLVAYRELFPEIGKEYGYYFGFAVVADIIAGGSIIHNAKARGNSQIAPIHRVKFTFDRRPEIEHNAGLLYHMYVNSPEWKRAGIFDQGISFDTSANPRIQMADLVARETMKLLDNQIGPVKRAPRQSILALAKSGRFKFWTETRSLLEVRRQFINDLEETSKKAEYKAWLEEHGYADNTSNRFRFILWRQSDDNWAALPSPFRSWGPQ